jgi:hypothetical protein
MSLNVLLDVTDVVFYEVSLSTECLCACALVVLVSCWSCN